MESVRHLEITDTEEALSSVHPLAVVSSRAVVGAPAEWVGKTSEYPAVIDEFAVVREFARVHAGTERETRVGKAALIMSGAHVGHDAVIGAGSRLAPNAVIGGCCVVGRNVKIGMGAVVKPFVTIGDDAVIGMGAVVTRSVPSGETWAGNPARQL